MDWMITDCPISTLQFQFKSGDLVEHNDRESWSFSVWGEDDVFHEISQVQPLKLSLLLNLAQSNGKPLPVSSYTERTVM